MDTILSPPTAPGNATRDILAVSESGLSKRYGLSEGLANLIVRARAKPDLQNATTLQQVYSALEKTLFDPDLIMKHAIVSNFNDEKNGLAQDWGKLATALTANAEQMLVVNNQQVANTPVTVSGPLTDLDKLDYSHQLCQEFNLPDGVATALSSLYKGSGTGIISEKAWLDEFLSNYYFFNKYGDLVALIQNWPNWVAAVNNAGEKLPIKPSAESAILKLVNEKIAAAKIQVRAKLGMRSWENQQTLDSIIDGVFNRLSPTRIALPKIYKNSRPDNIEAKIFDAAFDDQSLIDLDRERRIEEQKRRQPVIHQAPSLLNQMPSMPQTVPYQGHVVNKPYTPYCIPQQGYTMPQSLLYHEQQIINKPYIPY